MDPLTLMASVSAAYAGIKKAVAVGREAHDIMRQLGKWAESADKMYGYIRAEQTKSTSIFKAVTFDKSESREALDMAAAHLQLKQMEHDIKQMFLYGELQELGSAGYSQFIQNRKKIREDREKQMREHAKRRADFFFTVFVSLVSAAFIGMVGYIMFVVYTIAK